MNCPFCDHDKTKTINTRMRKARGEGYMYGYRRRECSKCLKRFTTCEIVRQANRTTTAVMAKIGKNEYVEITNEKYSSFKETAIEIVEKIIEQANK